MGTVRGVGVQEPEDTHPPEPPPLWNVTPGAMLEKLQNPTGSETDDHAEFPQEASPYSKWWGVVGDIGQHCLLREASALGQPVTSQGWRTVLPGPTPDSL